MLKSFKMTYLYPIALSAILPIAAMASTPQNIGKLQQQLIKYHDSGQYQKALDKVDNEAIAYVKKRVAENKASKHPKKLAVVFDIDETSLSNYPDMARMAFGGTPKAVNDAEDLGHDPAIPGTLKLYNYAKANDVAVIFITGRAEYQRPATIKNLYKAGYSGWDELHLKSNDYKLASASPYKIKERKKVTMEGYDIIANIGDQQSDLRGGYADKTFKLVDPFCYIP